MTLLRQFPRMEPPGLEADAVDSAPNGELTLAHDGCEWRATLAGSDATFTASDEGSFLDS